MIQFAVLAVAAVALVAVGSAPAEAHGHAHGQGHGAHPGHAQPERHSDNEAVRAYRAANDRMHADMDIEFTGDADVDFARGMIPHHRGAIDMARVVLEHGADREIRALAEEIIAAQESEIAFLKEWLERQGR